MPTFIAGTRDIINEIRREREFAEASTEEQARARERVKGEGEGDYAAVQGRGAKPPGVRANQETIGRMEVASKAVDDLAKGPIRELSKDALKGYAGGKAIEAGTVIFGVARSVVGVAAESRLIGANRAIIDPRKLTEYALNTAHPDGRHKAHLFQKLLGYNRDNYQGLLDQLRRGVMEYTPSAGKIDAFGSRFTLDIPVTGPAGEAVVRTGWIYKAESLIPELTTLFVR